MTAGALREALAAFDTEAALRVVRGHSRRGLVSEHSLASYRDGLNAYFEYLRERHLSVLNVDRIEAGLYRDHLRARHAAGTVVTRMAPVRQLYRTLVLMDVLPGDPFHDVVVTKSDDAPPEPYTAAEVARMLEVPLTPTEEVMLLLGANAGLRRDEMLRLAWEDVDLGGRRMRVLGKGRKVRAVRVSRSLHDALGRLLASRDDQRAQDRVLGMQTPRQLTYALRKIVVRAGVKWRGVHSLRRAAGSRLHRETGSLQAAQKLLGHKNISTTVRYTYHEDTHDAAVDEW